MGALWPRPEVYVTINAAGGSNKQGAVFLAWLRRLAASVVIVCEADGFHDVLGKAGRLFVGQVGRGRREVGVVLVGRGRGVLKMVRLTKFIERGQPKPLLWHDRWLALVTAGTRPRNRRRIYSTHANAVIQVPKGDGRLDDNAGARAWADGQDLLEAMLRQDIKAGRRVMHGCDANQRKLDGQGHHNPAQMYERLGMEYVVAEMMWFAWNPDRDELVKYEVLGTPPGSDGHPTLVVTLRRRTKKGSR